MIEGVLLLWYVLTFFSLLFLLWDQFTNTPSIRIMTVGWFLIILYTGPLGLFIYLLSCRQPLPDTHDQFINVHWKQTVGSLIHCVAGDATAIIVMAAILHYFIVPNGTEVIIEYVAAYLFGLFIFQAVFMRSMFSSYGKAVKKTIFAETVSMNLVMTGMFPVMVILQSHFPVSSNPLTAYFWGRMSIATMVGFVIAYPINSWMVKKNIKHGMMSKPDPSNPMPHMEHMQPYALPMQRQIVIVVGTYLILFAAMWVTSLIVPVNF